MDGVLRCIYPRSTYTLEEELNYVLRVGRPRLLLRRFGIVALKCRCWLVVCVGGVELIVARSEDVLLL